MILFPNNYRINRVVIIFSIYKIFGQMDQQGLLQNLDVRFPCESVQEIFTQLKVSKSNAFYLSFLKGYIII